MAELRFHGGGWLRGPWAEERWDHGKDGVLRWRGIVQAPGAGHCIGIGKDAPFSNGFGPRFALIRIEDRKSRWDGFDAYVGHDTALVAPGQHFPFGFPIAIADQGHPSQIGIHPASPPGDGGWFEIGQFFAATGRCGVDNGGAAHWWADKFMTDLVIKTPDPELRIGDKGRRVRQMTGWLYDCGYLTRRPWEFHREVHGAVIAFKKHHHIPRPSAPRDGGVVDHHTSYLLRRSAHWCRKHHHPEIERPLINRSVLLDPQVLARARRVPDRLPEGAPR